MKNKKTHILWNPNKNYFGSWDLVKGGDDLILTIESMAWEDVEDPSRGTKDNPHKEQKRVVHWVEKYKPLICNQTNASAILAATDVRYIEDLKGEYKKVALFVGQQYNPKLKRKADAVRIRATTPDFELPKLKDSNLEAIAKNLKAKNKTIVDLKKIMSVTPKQESIINSILNPVEDGK